MATMMTLVYFRISTTTFVRFDSFFHLSIIIALNIELLYECSAR